MAAKRFKPGDEVIIREDLKPDVIYGEINTNDEMMLYRGETGVVKSLKEGCGPKGKGIFYELIGCCWFWDDEMLIPVSDNEELEDGGYNISYLFGEKSEGK